MIIAEKNQTNTKNKLNIKAIITYYKDYQNIFLK